MTQEVIQSHILAIRLSLLNAPICIILNNSDVKDQDKFQKKQVCVYNVMMIIILTLAMVAVAAGPGVVSQ